MSCKLINMRTLNSPNSFFSTRASSQFVTIMSDTAENANHDHAKRKCQSRSRSRVLGKSQPRSRQKTVKNQLIVIDLKKIEKCEVLSVKFFCVMWLNHINNCAIPSLLLVYITLKLYFLSRVFFFFSCDI